MLGFDGSVQCGQRCQQQGGEECAVGLHGGFFRNHVIRQFQSLEAIANGTLNLSTDRTYSPARFRLT